VSAAGATLRRYGAAHLVGGFVSLVDKTARAKLAYRVSTLIAFVANGLGYSIFLLVWLEVYRQRGSGAGPVPRSFMIPYLVAAFVLNSVLTLSVEFRFFQRVRQGLVAVDLIRPLGFLGVQMAQALGDVVVNLVFAVPVAAAGLLVLGREALPARAEYAGAAVASAALAFVIHFAVSYLILQATFVLQSGYGIFFTRVALHQVFSGLSAPLAAFPPALRAVAAWLPFRHVIETPVLIWLGGPSPGAVAGLLAIQAAWAVGLLAGGMLLFDVALRRHEIQGG
jgi:ABC-2 type transport system permease protein